MPASLAFEQASSGSSDISFLLEDTDWLSISGCSMGKRFPLIEGGAGDTNLEGEAFVLEGYLNLVGEELRICMSVDLLEGA